MVVFTEESLYLISFIILAIGIIFSIIPVIIYRRVYGLKVNDLKSVHMLLNYYAIIGITIMIIGFLLVLIFSDKLFFPKF